jgi:hypothetical protein
MMLLSLNEAFDRRSIDILLMLSNPAHHRVLVSGDALLDCAALLASGLVSAPMLMDSRRTTRYPEYYSLKLTDKGRLLVEAWKEGDQSRFKDFVA